MHRSILFLRKSLVPEKSAKFWVILLYRMPPMVLLTTFSTKPKFCMEPVTRAVWGSWARLDEEHLLYELESLTQKGENLDMRQTDNYGLYMSPGSDINSTESLRSVTWKVIIYNYGCTYLCRQTWIPLPCPVWSEARLEQNLLRGGFVDVLPWRGSDL